MILWVLAFSVLTLPKLTLSSSDSVPRGVSVLIAPYYCLRTRSFISLVSSVNDQVDGKIILVRMKRKT